MKNPKLSYFEKLNIKKHLPLALKHQFWDNEPIKKFLSKAPEQDGFILS
jgi:hypothetical protein